MAVVTTDVIIQGTRREDLKDWFDDPDHHDRILQGAFDSVERKDDRTWVLTLKAVPLKRVITYHFDRLDRDHRGRRVLCSTSGHRVEGKLHYSLRTPRASKDTLVTLHMDYEPGGLFGRVIDSGGMREGLEQALTKVLANLQRELNAT